MPPVSGPAWPILTVTVSSAGAAAFGASAFFGSSLPQPYMATRAAATSVRPSWRVLVMEPPEWGKG